MIDHYDWAGGREAMLRFGPVRGPVVVAAMPLLEEWNRTRTFTVALLRALGTRGIGSVLPDLPGHGESLTAVADLTLDRLAEAMEAVTHGLRSEGRRTIGLGIRSGALIHGRSPHAARWDLAPMTGAEWLGELHRTWLAGGPARDRSLDTMISGSQVPVVGGTTLSSTFLHSFANAAPDDFARTRRRVVRVATDSRHADRHVEGAPLWRRTEPETDPALVQILGDDIAAWIQICAA